MTNSANKPGDRYTFRQALIMSGSFVAVLWLVYLGAMLFDLKLVTYGIYPRHIAGAVGIVFAPFIHGSLAHLFSNSAPIMILGTALLYGYPRSAGVVLGCLYIGTGIGVWLLGRSAYHIGASGLAFGMMFFVFIIGTLRWDRRAIALSLLVFFLYGSMFWGIFPTDPSVSFESHFFGALIGTILAFLFRNSDPPSPDKRYSWEEEENESQRVEFDPEQDDRRRLH